MITKPLPVLALASGLLIQGVCAEMPPSVQPSMPSTVAPAPVLAPDQIIYTSAMPSIADLNSGAAAQGLSILQVVPSGVQTTVIYRYPDGKTRVVAYQLPPASGLNSAPTVVTSPPSVVYDLPPPVVNYYYDPPYPRYVYPPFSLHVGFGVGRRHWR